MIEFVIGLVAGFILGLVVMAALRIIIDVWLQLGQEHLNLPPSDTVNVTSHTKPKRRRCMWD